MRLELYNRGWGAAGVRLAFPSPYRKDVPTLFELTDGRWLALGDVT
jgi:hypothetical protein